MVDIVVLSIVACFGVSVICMLIETGYLKNNKILERIGDWFINIGVVIFFGWLVGLTITGFTVVRLILTIVTAFAIVTFIKIHKENKD